MCIRTRSKHFLKVVGGKSRDVCVHMVEGREGALYGVYGAYFTALSV